MSSSAGKDATASAAAAGSAPQRRKSSFSGMIGGFLGSMGPDYKNLTHQRRSSLEHTNKFDDHRITNDMQSAWKDAVRGGKEESK